MGANGEPGANDQRGILPTQRGALATGLRVLETLVAAHGPMGVSELAAALGIDKANAHRTLAVLRRFGYVEQDATTRRYAATVRVVELAHQVLGSRELTVVAAPHLKALWAASRENVHLAVLAADHVVYVSTINGPTLLSANASVGQSAPLHCTATGKATLAFLARHAREQLAASIEYERYTPTTITQPADLLEHLATVRLNGYAVDDREYHPGVRCVAAPVFGMGGLIGTLGLSAPADRLNGDRLKVLAPLVVDTAARVSRELGGSAMRGAS
jgi:IclR family transcriptional regulator, KDG regulon repressor